MQLIRFADADVVELGCALLSSGGGGSPRGMVGWLRRLLGERGAQVTLVEPGELAEDVVALPIGFIGSDISLEEMPPGGPELPSAYEAISRACGRAPQALMAIEAGGLNCPAAIIAAALLDLPLVDADLVGRASPSIDLFAPAVGGVDVSPIALAGLGGRSILIEGHDVPSAEASARAYVGAVGGWAALAVAPMSTAVIAEHTVVGSMTRVLELGRRALSLHSGMTEEEVAAHLGGVALISGRVSELSSAPDGTTTAWIPSRDGRIATLVMRSEYLVVLVDGEVVSTTPEIVAVLDAASFRTVPCDQLRPGLAVALVALPAPAFWLRPENRRAMAPSAFGLAAPLTCALARRTG